MQGPDNPIRLYYSWAQRHKRACQKMWQPHRGYECTGRVHDIKDLSAQKNRLSSEVKVLQDAVDNLKGQQEAIRNSITGLLNPILNEITKAFTDGAKQMADEYDKQIADMKEASVEYGRRQEAAAYLAE